MLGFFLTSNFSLCLAEAFSDEAGGTSSHRDAVHSGAGQTAGEGSEILCHRFLPVVCCKVGVAVSPPPPPHPSPSVR